jgi:hypothetical protein
MSCDSLKERLADYWAGNLGDSVVAEIETHLRQCAACKAEAESLGTIWAKLGEIPDEHPSPALRTRFEATLDEFRREADIHRLKPVLPLKPVPPWLDQWWPKRPILQFALSMACLAFGLLIGHALTVDLRGNATEVSRLQEEVRSTRQLVALTLLQQQSASERLKGVDFSYRIPQPEPEVLSALLQTVDNDQNVNVRLAAVDALHRSSNNDMVRRGLVEALPKQQSPMVQMALIEAVTDLHEKDAAGMLQKVAEDPHANQAVRQRAEWALQQLR